MAINVTPIPGLDPAINDIRRRTADFINDEILPNEEVLWRSRRGAELDEDEREQADRREHRVARGDQGQGQEGRAVGAPPAARSTAGMGLDFLALAYMYEILAYAVGAVGALRHRRAQLRQRHHPGQVRHRGAEAEVAAAAHRRARWSRASR